MRVGRLVRTRADAVRNWMRRLPRVAGLRKSVADQDVELGETGAGPAMTERAAVNVEQDVEQLAVDRVELPGAHVLRVVAPVTVRADPDFEQCRLVLLHEPVARCREGADPRPRPHERK